MQAQVRSTRTAIYSVLVLTIALCESPAASAGTMIGLNISTDQFNNFILASGNNQNDVALQAEASIAENVVTVTSADLSAGDEYYGQDSFGEVIRTPEPTVGFTLSLDPVAPLSTDPTMTFDPVNSSLTFILEWDFDEQSNADAMSLSSVGISPFDPFTFSAMATATILDPFDPSSDFDSSFFGGGSVDDTEGDVFVEVEIMDLTEFYDDIEEDFDLEFEYEDGDGTLTLANGLRLRSFVLDAAVTTTAVPEPSSALLLAVGAMGFTGMSRVRRKRATAKRNSL